jgi:hypothetical protein
MFAREFGYSQQDTDSMDVEMFFDMAIVNHKQSNPKANIEDVMGY